MTEKQAQSERLRRLQRLRRLCREVRKRTEAASDADFPNLVRLAEEAERLAYQTGMCAPPLQPVLFKRRPEEAAALPEYDPAAPGYDKGLAEADQEIAERGLAPWMYRNNSRDHHQGTLAEIEGIWKRIRSDGREPTAGEKSELLRLNAVDMYHVQRIERLNLQRIGPAEEDRLFASRRPRYLEAKGWRLYDPTDSSSSRDVLVSAVAQAGRGRRTAPKDPWRGRSKSPERALVTEFMGMWVRHLDEQCRAATAEAKKGAARADADSRPQGAGPPVVQCVWGPSGSLADIASRFRERNPDLPDAAIESILASRAISWDPTAVDPDARSLVPSAGKFVRHEEERVHMAFVLGLEVVDPLTSQLLDALEVVWSFPGEAWFRELKWCVLKQGYALSGLRPEVALAVTRAWCAQRLCAVIAGQARSLHSRGAALGLSALVLGDRSLREGARSSLLKSAGEWPAAKALLESVADFGGAPDSIVTLAALNRELAHEGSPAAANEGAPVDSGVRPGQGFPGDAAGGPRIESQPDWMANFLGWLRGKGSIKRRGSKYAVEILAGLAGQTQRRSRPWICEKVLAGPYGTDANTENGAIKDCLAGLAGDFSLLESKAGGQKPGYVLDEARWLLLLPVLTREKLWFGKSSS